MSIKNIAEPLDLNESTISRTIQGKYILCPFGIISLKSLFTSKLSAQQGDETFSSANVKQKIKRLIETEQKEKPLTDQAISVALNKAGIMISRRTVAKYRDELKLPVAMKRKTYDKI